MPSVVVVLVVVNVVPFMVVVVVVVVYLHPHFCEDVNILKIVYFVLLANYYYYHF